LGDKWHCEKKEGSNMRKIETEVLVIGAGAGAKLMRPAFVRLCKY